MAWRLLKAAAIILLALLPARVALGQIISTIPLAADLNSPVAITHAGDGSGRLFIVEQGGRMLIYRENSLLAAPFLDIRDRVGCCGERGLLGLAFHPSFEENGWFFVNYTNTDFDTVIARYRVSADADVADPDSEEILLTIGQPFSNHNGGQLAFGPDGYLYIGMGDGGGAGDTQNNAQNPMSLLGKMLRLDVDGEAPFGIPPDNPFMFDDSTRDEIWALGLRNPFRFSFDRVTGDLFIADVGQNLIEEVNLHPANTPAGENYGWRLMEGSRCFNPSSNCDDGSLTLPVFEYQHTGGRCSVIGGFRYRGNQIGALQGKYVYGDFCTGEIFSATFSSEVGWTQEVLLDTHFSISTFGEDEDGELYVADLGDPPVQEGAVHKLVTPLTISPASGTYLISQFIDLSLILRGTGTAVETITARLNGNDVSKGVNNCLVEGSLAEGGSSFRCPSIPLNILTPGTYTFTVDVILGDGNTVSDTVQWEVLANSEP